MLTFIRIDEENKRYAFYKCNCGKETRKNKYDVGYEKIISCGCYIQKRIKEGLNKKHGLKNTREYNIWIKIKSRCYNRKNKDYLDYGGRGIIVCERWLEKFENFYEDMGPSPSNDHSIHRKNDGNYCPECCVWATQKEQNNDRRSNLRITINGITKNLNEWCEYYNINISTVSHRIKRGKNYIEALITPVRKYK